MKSLPGDRRVFDVSLVAGHRDRWGDASDFPAGFVRKLHGAAFAVKREVPALWLTPAGRQHFTLRAVYRDRRPDFARKVPLVVRQKRYAEVLSLLRAAKERHVVWQGYRLNVAGILMLEGRAVGNWLTTLRREIDRRCDQPALFPPSGYCHIVLARPLRSLRESERRWIQRWIGAQTPFRPIRMRITRLRLLVTRNHFGTLYA